MNPLAGLGGGDRRLGIWSAAVDRGPRDCYSCEPIASLRTRIAIKGRSPFSSAGRPSSGYGVGPISRASPRPRQASSIRISAVVAGKEKQVKAKMLGLVTLAALLAMTSAGVTSAMGESTQLCSTDPATSCTAATHVHETSVGKGKLLASSITVECNALFLGEVGSLGAPQVIKGNFTYTNCGSCIVTEVEKEGHPVGSTIEVLKLGNEIADVTGEGEVHVTCSGLNCVYNGEGLEGTARGPLLSQETNGEVSLQEQETHKIKGLFCPSTAKLDIVTTPLSATYIGN